MYHITLQGSSISYPKLWLWLCRTSHHKICHFALLFWVVGTQKTATVERGFFFWTPLFYLNLQPLKGTQLSCLLPESFSDQGRLTLNHWGGNWKSTPHADKLCHSLHTSHPKDPFVFPKNHSLWLERPISPSPFPIKMVFMSEFYTTLGSYSFLPGISHIWCIHVNKILFVFLLLICVSV